LSIVNSSSTVSQQLVNQQSVNQQPELAPGEIAAPTNDNQSTLKHCQSTAKHFQSTTIDNQSTVCQLLTVHQQSVNS
jgi:hypothetical protein